MTRIVAHISDIHFGKIDLRIADALAAELNALGLHLLIVSGDLTQRARAPQFAAARRFLERLPKPQLIVPGNHDIPLYDIGRRFLAPTQFFRRYITRELRPVYRDEQMIVAGINSARAFSPRLKGFWKDGGISSLQLGWLRTVFANAQPGQTKIVVTHHPFIPAPNGDPLDLIHGAAEALPQLCEMGVDLLLAGHLHASYGGDARSHHAALKQPILSIQAGTATSTRLRAAANAFNLFQIESDKITLSVRSWNGASFATSSTRQFTHQPQGWHEQL